MKRWLIQLIGVWALATGGEVAAHDDVLRQLAQNSKPAIEVNLCDTGVGRPVPEVGQRRCPDGHIVRRTLLIPGNVNMDGYANGPDGKNYKSWGVYLSIIVTDDGLRFLPPPPDLKRSEIQTDTVLLQPGWRGIFEFELTRAANALETMYRSDHERRNIRYVWDDARDSDFKVFEVAEDTDKSGLPPKLYPRLFVPKSGEHIFFQCVGPAYYQGKLTDPSCDVRDFLDPEDDSLRYRLRYTRLRDWRRYSTWLWTYINALTIR